MSAVGLTMMVNIGKWGGFYAGWSKIGVRLCLGWLAVSFYWLDMDEMLARMAAVTAGVGEAMKEVSS